MAGRPYFGFNTTQAKTLERLIASDDAGFAALAETVTDMSEALEDLTTYTENLNAWAIALATKLNADAGVTDVNYDTDPQA